MVWTLANSMGNVVMKIAFPFLDGDKDDDCGYHSEKYCEQSYRNWSWPKNRTKGKDYTGKHHNYYISIDYAKGWAEKGNFADIIDNIKTCKCGYVKEDK